MKYFYLIIFILACSGSTYSQRPETQEIENLADSIFNNTIINGNLKGAVISVVSRDSVIFANSYGYSDADNRKKVTVDRSLFQVGSVGKLFTALSVLQLTENGQLDLNANISNYVGDLVDSSRGLTLQHLLTHTGGLNERVIGYAARSWEDIEPLNTHLPDRLPSPYIDPGEEISYSNYGYALAGHAVEQVSGSSFIEFVQRELFERVGMTSSTYEYWHMQGRQNDIVTGFRKQDSTFISLPIFYRHPIPAGGVWSTAEDMQRFMRLLLNEGSATGEQIISQTAINQMLSTQFTGHSLLTGYSLGMEEQRFGVIRAFSKGGAVPGFRSILIIYPDLELGVFASVNMNDDAVLETFIDSFNTKILGASTQRALLPGIEADLDKFAGSYRENRYNRNTIEDIAALVYTNLWVGSEGTLRCYQDGEIQDYQAVDPVVFQNVNDPDRFMVFEEDSNGEIVKMMRGNRFAGSMIPATYEKLTWVERHNAVNEIIGWVLIVIVLFLILMIFRMLVNLVRRSRPGFWKWSFISSGAAIWGTLFATFTLIYMALYFFPVIGMMKSGELFFGMDSSLIKYHFIPFFLIIVLIFLFYQTFRIWRNASGTVLMRLYYTIFTLCSSAFLLYLHQWHFIGFNY